MVLELLGPIFKNRGHCVRALRCHQVVNFVKPEKQRALRKYLGMVNYYLIVRQNKRL